MAVWLRTVLIWMLALALPAQGVAAATMALCMPHPHAASQSPAAPHEKATASAHAGHASHQHSASSRAGADTGLPGSSLAQADGHKCSACASCCSAAAIGSAALRVPAPGVTATAFSAVVPSVEKLATDTPDRPPRGHFV